MDIPVELYEAVREIYPESQPPFRARPFDVQLIGGMVLYQGKIAEMKTGEGKTIVGPLACYLACIERLKVHVVTVNDYLVQRDRDWTFPFFRALGLTVGAIHPMHMQPEDDQARDVPVRCGVRHHRRVRLRLPARQHEAAAWTSRCSAAASSRSWTRWTRS